ncbi:MAG: hypothetical protein H7222_03815 [Methylotenera sp.]|nr:hypothetical protein [Oligoflexia bacterium]
MKKNETKGQVQEFEAFLKTEAVSVPATLSESIFFRIEKNLNPNPWLIFSKLAGIHLGVGALTLSICPQFGVRFFGSGLGVVKLFFHLGTYGCMMACGAFFVGASVLVAASLLSRDELRKLRAHPWLQLSSVVLLSLGGFIMADAEILIGFAFAWALGSLLGGFTALQVGWYFRASSMSYLS